ncbi:hypothetical protein BCR34DRAFT_601710 [Clohesyomyces aquaticus]|uniref:Uncharacterized protein n=1 Tax=Clohesyomyces aquaticus TaxID=1231657 RepID=A0A1Y1ZL45_9PLEO|nr:hypothetical protein BCR34DRAFT_601710 [Clohesyomyces aquaticus]
MKTGSGPTRASETGKQKQRAKAIQTPRVGLSELGHFPLLSSLLGGTDIDKALASIEHSGKRHTKPTRSIQDNPPNKADFPNYPPARKAFPLPLLGVLPASDSSYTNAQKLALLDLEIAFHEAQKWREDTAEARLRHAKLKLKMENEAKR